jgi:GntR family transcriptional regulator / MocR family aminotransferase
MYLQLDGKGELYRQLLRALKQAILDGRLAPGTRLPASRSLSAELGLSRNTVLAAYDLLCAEHLAIARRASGTYVAPATCPARPRKTGRQVEPQSRYADRLRHLPPHNMPMRRPGVRVDFQYGEPLADLQLFTAWSGSLSYAAMHTEPRYPPVAGLSALRVQIAAHLGRRRGVNCTAEDVIVVNGTQQAFSLLARVLLDEGHPVVLEDPSYALSARCLQAHGAALSFVPVDAEGLVVDALPTEGVRLIGVTPSHQFVSGVTMSVRRRMALLRYASDRCCWIVEDDYDGEFGFEGRMLPALRSLDADDRVVYVGSFSKSMFPALRLGYLVCPRALHGDLLQAKLMADIACGGIEQVALAHFMDMGGFDRHLKRTSLELRRRRAALLKGIAEHCGGGVQVQDSGAGMHCIAWLPGLSAAHFERLVEQAAGRGLGLHSVSPHYARPPRMAGLLLGFAGTSVPQLRLATRLLGESLRAVQALQDTAHRSVAAVT